VDEVVVAELWNPFHDVGLAAVRPAHGSNVRSQHPKRRPQAVTDGQFYSRFNAAILKLLQTLRFILVDVHVPPGVLTARMTKLPLPSMKTFGIAAPQGAALDPAAQ